MKYKGLDSVVDSMVKTFEDLLDEYGEEIKRKDPELYLESMNTMCALKDMAEDDITFVEVVKYATASSKLFKRIMDLYGIDKELRDRIGK